MAPQSALVLGYHTVSTTWDNSVAVRPDDLRAQLELLTAAGYRAVTIREAVEQPQRHTVALTFDDGFLAVHELALPLLEEFGMVATVFVPTSFVCAGRELSWDGYEGPRRGPGREMAAMTWEHLHDLSAHGWEVASHTRTHPHLPRLDDATLAEELQRSREECSDAIGTACTSIAYPYGEVDERVREATASAGYLAAVALGPQWRRGDPLWWPRTGIYRGDDLARFRLKLNPLTRSRLFAAGIGSVRRVGHLRG